MLEHPGPFGDGAADLLPRLRGPDDLDGPAQLLQRRLHPLHMDSKAGQLDVVEIVLAALAEHVRVDGIVEQRDAVLEGRIGPLGHGHTDAFVYRVVQVELLVVRVAEHVRRPDIPVTREEDPSALGPMHQVARRVDVIGAVAPGAVHVVGALEANDGRVGRTNLLDHRVRVCPFGYLARRRGCPRPHHDQHNDWYPPGHLFSLPFASLRKRLPKSTPQC